MHKPNCPQAADPLPGLVTETVEATRIGLVARWQCAACSQCHEALRPLPPGFVLGETPIAQTYDWAAGEWRPANAERVPTSALELEASAEVGPRCEGESIPTEKVARKRK